VRRESRLAVPVAAWGRPHGWLFSPTGAAGDRTPHASGRCAAWRARRATERPVERRLPGAPVVRRVAGNLAPASCRIVPCPGSFVTPAPRLAVPVTARGRPHGWSGRRDGVEPSGGASHSRAVRPLLSRGFPPTRSPSHPMLVCPLRVRPSTSWRSSEKPGLKGRALPPQSRRTRGRQVPPIGAGGPTSQTHSPSLRPAVPPSRHVPGGRGDAGSFCRRPCCWHGRRLGVAPSFRVGSGLSVSPSPAGMNSDCHVPRLRSPLHRHHSGFATGVLLAVYDRKLEFRKPRVRQRGGSLCNRGASCPRRLPAQLPPLASPPHPCRQGRRGGGRVSGGRPSSPAPRGRCFSQVARPTPGGVRRASPDSAARSLTRRLSRRRRPGAADTRGRFASLQGRRAGLSRWGSRPLTPPVRRFSDDTEQESNLHRAASKPTTASKAGTTPNPHRAGRVVAAWSGAQPLSPMTWVPGGAETP
jgi:hypothetical protein